MKVMVFGAAGRTGRQVVAALVAAGHEVTAAVRSGPAFHGAVTVRPDLSDADAVRAAVAGCDAVISTLASGPGNPACLTLARALLPLAGLRFVSVAGAAVDAPGDAKALPDRIISRIMRVVAGKMLAERQTEHDLLAVSDLRWTMLRPPRLVDGAATGRIAITTRTPAGMRLTRADLAATAVAVLTRDDLIGRAPFVAETTGART